MWHDEPLKFVGLDNFIRLFTEPGFLQYLGNTLYMMMAIPLGIGASLLAAMMLSKDTRGGGGRVFAWLVSAAILIAAVLLLGGLGLGGTGMTILLAGLLGGVLVAGTLGGNTVYRTLFYAPAFTAGVATYILWKKLYAPQKRADQRHAHAGGRRSGNRRRGRAGVGGATRLLGRPRRLRSAARVGLADAAAAVDGW